MPLFPEFSASRREPSRTLRFGAISRRSNRTSPTTNATQTTAGGVRAARSFNKTASSLPITHTRAGTLRSATAHVLNASARNRLCRTHIRPLTGIRLKFRLTRCAVFWLSSLVAGPATGPVGPPGPGWPVRRPGPRGRPRPARIHWSRATRRPAFSCSIVAHVRIPGRRPPTLGPVHAQRSHLCSSGRSTCS